MAMPVVSMSIPRSSSADCSDVQYLLVYIQ